MLAVVNKVTPKEFNSTILNKGTFKQYVVSPYSGDERTHFDGVLIISNKVNEVTWLCDRNRKLALVLPLSTEGINATVVQNKEYLKELTRVHATYFTVSNFDTREKLFSISA